jgi:integrase
MSSPSLTTTAAGSAAVASHAAALATFDQFDLGAAAEATELRAQVRAAVALLPGLPAADPGDSYDPRTLTEAWLIDRAPTSRRSYFLALADFLLWCARNVTNPLAARRADTDSWKAQMTAQKRGPGNVITLVQPSANTVCKRLSAVSSWFSYLADNELAVPNPAARTTRPAKPERSRYPALTADELAAFLDWLLERAERLGTEAAWRDAAMFSLLFGTGLRIAPITAALISDIGFESDGRQQHAVLHYVRKGGGQDWVPLSEQVLDVQHRYWSVRATNAGVTVNDLAGHLFVTTAHPRRPDLAGGNPCRQNRTFDHLRVLARAAGLSIADTIVLHSTRRTAGTLALANGATLRQVQDLLGHKDPRVTAGYDDARHRLSTSPVYTIASVLTEAHRRRTTANSSTTG